MKLGVLGLWHLGAVTAACAAAAGIPTVGVDDDRLAVDRLGRGEPPLLEPGLGELLTQGRADGLLTVTAEPSALADRDVVWVCHDTPVDEEDRADVDSVLGKVEAAFPHMKDGAVVLVSAQLPVGSVARLERAFARVAAGRTVGFACSPENLRLGRAVEVFRNPGRIVIGVRDARTRKVLEPLLSRFCDDLIWTTVESAEMAKHALNAFLAVSVTFANELAVICGRVGADARAVEAALRTDPRVGRNAYVRPGAAFAGGTLARDVRFLATAGQHHRLRTPLIASIIESNDAHRSWPLDELHRRLGDVAGRRIAILGLAYKPGTNALRRSAAIEYARALVAEGAQVQAFDPVVRALPAELGQGIVIADDPRRALRGASAVLVATEWPELRQLTAEDFADAQDGCLVLDPGRWLSPAVAASARLSVISIGAIG